MKKLLVAVMVMSLAIVITVPVSAFTTANMRPGYSALLFSLQKGVDNTYLNLGFDLGLTYTVGLEGAFVYTGEEHNRLDLGLKFRLTELRDFNMIGKVGFHGAPLKDWRTSIGLQAEKSFTSFFKGFIGAGVTIKDWSGLAYMLGAEYLFTPATALQFGVKRHCWNAKKDIGQLIVGIRAQF